MNEKIYLIHSTLIVTFRCTLKCKHCLMYAPFVKQPKDFTTEELCRTIEMYFKLVDHCHIFNVQGGEPLMHKGLPDVLDKLLEYRSQTDKVLVTTNGTLLPSNELLECLIRHKEHIQVNISNYGKDLSKRVDDITELLDNNGIKHHQFKYYGDDMHYGGWLDFTDHTYKNMTEAEIIEQCKECGCRTESQFCMRPGEMFCCGRNMRRVDLGIIPKDKKAYVDMFDERSIEEKRQNVIDIINAPYTPACAYCYGKRKERTHQPPAVQLTNLELKNGVETI